MIPLYMAMIFKQSMLSLKVPILKNLLIHLIVLLILVNFWAHKTNDRSQRSQYCSGLVVDIKRFNKQILNNHQYSPRWMVLNKNILLSRWVESDCQKRESWPVGY
jgi:hypothetical protein